MYGVAWRFLEVSHGTQAAYNKLLVHHVEKHSKTVGIELSQNATC